MNQTPASSIAGKDKRRFPRYDVQIPVFLRRKNGDLRLVTGDVSRHGAFVRSDQPAPLRQLVQLRFRLPDHHGEIDAMCMVARWLGPETARGPGMGVDFFALSKDAKNAWERFLQDLRTTAGFEIPPHTPANLVGTPVTPIAGAPIGVARPSQTLVLQPGGPPPRAPVAAAAAPVHSGMPDWVAPNSLVATSATLIATPAPAPRPAPPTSPPMPALSTIPQPAISTIPQPAPTVPAPAPQAQPPPSPTAENRVSSEGSVVILRLADRDAVRAFVDNEVARGGMFLNTPLLKEIGEKLDIVLVHPESDDEFHLEGTVVRRVMNGPPEHHGLGIFFRGLTSEGHKQLVGFIESGIEVIELGRPISQRQVDLENAVGREPDSADALEALGSYLLDEEGDLGGALNALTRALVLAPSDVSIHASLARAYRKIGDHVKVRAHERVAEALMQHRDRLKVRLGVGDEQ